MHVANRAEMVEPNQHAKPDGPLYRRRSVRPDIRIAILAAAAFFLLELFLVQNHEMWRDELQAWLLARDSAGVFDLMRNLRYEGHPGLWHLLLMPLTRIAAQPFSMQVLHVAIASASVFVLVRHAPFRWPVTLLICFSYYLFYEYAQLARNYAVGVLLTFILCTLFPFREKLPVWIALVLFLLCHTSVFGIIIALSFSLAVLADKFTSLGLRRAAMGVPPREILAGVIVWAGVLTAVLQIIPPSDFGFGTTWNFSPNGEAFSDVTRALAGAFLPLPQLDLHYWGRLQILSWGLPSALLHAALVALLVCFAILLRRSPFALIFFALSAGGLLVFFFAKFSGYPRHHGFLFITLVASLWMSPGSIVPSLSRAARRSVRMADKLGSGGVVFVLLVQAAAGLMAAAQDYLHTFSNAQRTAEFVKSNDLDRGLVAGYRDFAASAVAGFLTIPVYYPESERYGTFVRWDDKRKRIRPRDMLARLIEEAADMNRFLLITNSPLFQRSRSIRVQTGGETVVLTRLFKADGAVLRDENFYVYSVTRN